MASDDAAMDVEQKTEAEEKKEELDPIAIMEAKLASIGKWTKTPEEELSAKILEAGGILAELVERDGPHISPDEVKSILQLYDLAAEKYAAVRSELGMEAAPAEDAEDADDDDGVSSEHLNKLLNIVWRWAMVQLTEQIAFAKLPKTILSAEQVQEVWNSKSIDKGLELLSSILKLKNFRTHTRNGIKADFFYYHMDHCQKMQFDPFKTAVFITLMDNVFKSAENSGWKSCTPAFDVFKEGILQHCVAEAGEDYEGFTPADVSALTQYIARTFFRYFNAFKFAFTRQPLVKNVVRTVTVEVPMVKSGMASATPAESAN